MIFFLLPSTVTYDVNTTQYEDDTIKCEKKIRESPNVTKVQLYVMLVLYNMRTVASNVRKKNKGTIECDKSTITCDVNTT